MKETTISCTYIGHSTTLIRLGNTSLLTDPNFSKRTLIFSRQVALPISPADIPDLSGVLISHTHFDHLNISSFKYISCTTPIIAPEGTAPLIGSYLPNPIIELSHNADYELNDGTKIIAVPIKHASGRVSHLRFKKANAYLIQFPNEKPGLSSPHVVSGDPARTVFFCADSGYGPQFTEIGNMGTIDLALLPIGGYRPRFLMRRFSMTPAEAVQAFEDLKAKHMIPIHYGTFRMTCEKLDEPLNWLLKILEERPDLKTRIQLIKPGGSFEWHL